VSGSSDVWIGSEREATNPFFGVWCCVVRSSFAGEILGAEERVSPLEEDVKGSLEAGKVADVLVLDRDALRCSDDDLRRVRVDAVVFDGRLVHEREGARSIRWR
jgi:predicted amidohydrolase YtcJ